MPTPIFPPRPQGRLDWRHLPRYEAMGIWVVQRKFNGKHVTIYVDPAQEEVGIWGRDTKAIKQFQLTPGLCREFLSLNLSPGNKYWFAGELMQKTTDPHYKDRIILFDLLQAGSRLFIRAPDQLGRLTLLSEICRNPTHLEDKHGIALHVTQNVWLAQTFSDNFTRHFEELLHIPEIEGLVLRRRGGILGNYCTRYWETSDLIRCRKSNKLYTH